MNLLKLYPLMSFAVILMAIVGQCLSQRNPWLLLAAGGLAALSRTISEGPRGITLSRPVSLMLTSVALIWSVLVAMGNLEQPVPAIGQFVVWLTVIKLYERHTLENEAERLILSLLLMVLACLISIDLIFGFLLLSWTTLGLVTLMLFQLTCAAEKSQRQRARVLGIASEVAPNPVSGTGLRRQYRNVTLASTLFIFLISTTIFLLFPRGLTSRLSTVALRSMAPREVGLSEGVDLLGQTRISLSAEQVLSVGLEDDEGETIQLNRALRLRASALTAYRGDGIWDAESFGLTNFEIQPEEWKSFFITTDDAEIVLQDVILDSPSEQLVSMSVPVELESEIGTSIVFRPSSQTIRVKRDSPTPLKYRIKAIPEPPLFRSMTSLTRSGPAIAQCVSESKGRGTRDLTTRVGGAAGRRAIEHRVATAVEHRRRTSLRAASQVRGLRVHPRSDRGRRDGGDVQDGSGGAFPAPSAVRALRILRFGADGPLSQRPDLLEIGHRIRDKPIRRDDGAVHRTQVGCACVE